MKPLVVLNVVGMTPALLEHMPNLSRLGWQAELGTVPPAVTCSAQATLLTALTPAQHGIVGNGWYFRDLGEIHLWRQHNRLVGGEKLWETARRARPGYTAANICWWYAMGASTDITVTPRPIYHAAERPVTRTVLSRRSPEHAALDLPPVVLEGPVDVHGCGRGSGVLVPLPLCARTWPSDERIFTASRTTVRLVPIRPASRSRSACDRRDAAPAPR